MKLQLSIQFRTDEGEKFFGEGPCRLLSGIRQHGSLRSAAIAMGMSYTKAFHMLKHTEACCGFPLCRRTIGGDGGGGSSLTPEAEDLLTRYEAFRADCSQAAARLYRNRFPEVSPWFPLQPPPKEVPSCDPKS